jgi:hypothetical protein
MKRHIIVAIIAAVLIIATFTISWILYPTWRELGLGGVLTLLVATILGVVALLQNLISIWKDLKDEPKSPEGHIDNPGQILVKNGKTYYDQEATIETEENKSEDSIIPDMPQQTISPEDNTPKSTFEFQWLWEQGESSAIFQGRLADAFPGLRGIEILRGEEAVDRLETLLQEPLLMQFSDGLIFSPFWWFRGLATSEIERFVRLAPDRFLLGVQEMRVDYVAAVRIFGSDERNFVYVQILAEEPTGVYKYADGWLEEYLKHELDANHGYYFYESYGIWKDKLLTAEEFEDGATIINGQPTRISDAELMQRFLTPYNFAICGQYHVLNSTRADQGTEILLNSILLGTKEVSDLVSYVRDLPRRPSRFGFS